MITGYRWRGDRALLVALILSIIVHFSGAAIYGLVTRALSHLHIAVPHPQPTEEFVTTSASLTFDRRPRPVRPRRASPSRPPLVARIAVTPSLPRVQAALPQLKPPPLVKPELSRLAPHAPAQGTPRPKPVQVAFAPHNPERTAGTPASSALSPQQLAQLNEDFTRTISQTRTVVNPLRVPNLRPAAPKHFALQFNGRIGELTAGQGYVYAIKAWGADGYDYYYVSYEYMWPDGTYENGSVPWPIRFPAEHDPIAAGYEGVFPLPPPPAGWQLPPNIHLGRFLRSFFPDQFPNN